MPAESPEHQPEPQPSTSTAADPEPRLVLQEPLLPAQESNDGEVAATSSPKRPPTLYSAPPRQRQYRSKSAVSSDPRSPYYISQGIQNNEAVRRSPSVSCVLDAIRKEAKEGDVPGVSRAALEKPSVSTIRQHYYPEGGWGWVVCACALLVHIITNGLHGSFGLLLILVRDQFKPEVYPMPAGRHSVWHIARTPSSAFCRSYCMRSTIVFET